MIIPVEIGKKYGRLTPLKRVPRKTRGPVWYRCICDCGTRKNIRGFSLTRGNTRSCGCLQIELTIKRSFAHGKCATSAYRVWMNMKRRCFDPRCEAFKYYGARGITVCKRWLSFPNFYKDMGDRPKDRSLDRINNDGNYEPSNCRWATHREQHMNRRKRGTALIGMPNILGRDKK